MHPACDDAGSRFLGWNNEAREEGVHEANMHGFANANHIGPEPCAGVREDVGEASAGDRIGQPLSREIDVILGADAVPLTEGNTDGCAIASARPARRGRDPGMCGRSLCGNREISCPDQGGSPPVARIGKARSRSR